MYKSPFPPRNSRVTGSTGRGRRGIHRSSQSHALRAGGKRTNSGIFALVSSGFFFVPLVGALNESALCHMILSSIITGGGVTKKCLCTHRAVLEPRKRGAFPPGGGGEGGTYRTDIRRNDQCGSEGKRKARGQQWRGVTGDLSPYLACREALGFVFVHNA